MVDDKSDDTWPDGFDIERVRGRQHKASSITFGAILRGFGLPDGFMGLSIKYGVSAETLKKRFQRDRETELAGRCLKELIYLERHGDCDRVEEARRLAIRAVCACAKRLPILLRKSRRYQWH